LTSRDRPPAPNAWLLGAAVVFALALAGCGGTAKQSTPAAQKLQREDLAAACRALEQAERPVESEVAATRAAWPLIANGLGANARALSQSPALAQATRAAAQLRLPVLFGEAHARSLTGPAAQLSGLFRSYALLSARGWTLLDAQLAQIRSGSPAAARFAAENAPLYIESIYDGHFTLAQIGKKLLAGYDKLGGAAAFGASLTQARVDALARTYSEARDRLHPHVAVRIGS
jgi:outer membrane murein-binding lipoprotein Lpp